jgi:hypothetical protein
MHWNSRRSNALVVVALLALPWKVASCGRTACITVTSAELAKNGGACPTPVSAMMRFSNVECGGGVSSVDSQGELDGTLCCYAVELSDASNEECEGFPGESTGGCEDGCVGGAGGGSFGETSTSFVSTSSGVGGSFGETSTSSGFGGFGGGPPDGGSGAGGFAGGE